LKEAHPSNRRQPDALVILHGKIGGFVPTVNRGCMNPA
jgi:hypothetical protein